MDTDADQDGLAQVTAVDRSEATVAGCASLAHALVKALGLMFAAEKVLPVVVPLLPVGTLPWELFSILLGYGFCLKVGSTARI